MFYLARSLLPLLMLMISPAAARTLIEQREDLKRSMRGLVDDDFGWRALDEIEQYVRQRPQPAFLPGAGLPACGLAGLRAYGLAGLAAS